MGGSTGELRNRHGYEIWVSDGVYHLHSVGRRTADNGSGSVSATKKEKRKSLKEEIKTNLAAGTVTIAKNSYSLPPLEIRLLDLFLNHPYRILNKEEIKRQIWESESVTDNTLYVHITKIKNLLQPHSYTITNIRNCGYRFENVS